MNCRICKAKSDELNVCQPFGPDDKPVFVLPGNHYRGFPTIRVCDACKERIEHGEEITITYKGQQAIINEKQQATA